MSSLAGALGETRSHPYQHASAEYGSEDVKMTSPSRNLPMKEEDAFPPKVEQDQAMDDLFGNDQDVEELKHEEPASPSASGLDSERLTSPERERRQALEYEEEEVPPELAVEVKEAEVAFPNIPIPRSSDNSNWVIKMPNFVKVDSKPFHPDTYIGPEQEEEELQQTETVREKTMSIKLRVENTVRWRWVKDETGQDKRQSNSRIIRWSDGSLSLRLGKELFDINQTIDTSAGIPRQLIGGSQSQSTQSQSRTPLGTSQGLTYLVAQHKRSQVLQAEAVITGYMHLRPAGMHSETHRMLVRAVGQKHSKVARLRMAPDPSMDPEREKLELMKQSAKRSRKKAEPDDGLGKRRRRRSWRDTASRDWTDDEEVAAMSEEEDDGLGSVHRTKRKESAKKVSEDYQEDDFLVADSSDEEGGFTENKRRRKDEDVDEDPLDKLDAQIEQQEDKKKRHHESPGDEGQVNSDKMDVESEEDDEGEELKVRRSGTSRVRKRVVNADEDEDY
ncbi:hypothetical protein AX17_003567 [Amanita inopinata Kibby_2008]|nr:hypothetical protein AX17_003567 [Amanita inopinata Kibby_2008]